MNFTHVDQLYAINSQRIQRDRVFILKEEMMKPRSNFGLVLSALGNWMVSKGEGLRKRYAVSGQINPLAYLQDESRIFKAQ